jgi:long-chain acyl-CoA synthetase
MYDVLAETAHQHGDAPALNQPVVSTGGSDRRYITYSWNEYLRTAEEIAAGLRSLGIGHGDVVAISSETRMEFHLADLGIMTNGAVAAALYPSYPVPDLLRTIQSAGARVLFVETPKMLYALAGASVDFFVLLTGEDPGAISLNGLREKGRDAMAADPGLLARIRAECSPQDIALLYLTSGATGDPKMVTITHHAVTSNLDMGPYVLPIGPEDSTVAFLPSAHIAQRVVIELLTIRCATPVTFAESLLKLPQEIKAVRPTLLLAPPRMWERIYCTVCMELRKRPLVARKAFYGALGMALAAARYRREGKPVPARIRGPLKIADRLMFRKVRERFGGRLTMALSGAAPLSKELAEFYEAIGMPLTEGYGLTEGGVVAMNPLGAQRPGSIGKPLPGVEFKVADGELLMHAPCLFSGYLNDPEATAEVLSDGWLRTGDLGYIDAEGYIFITGRKKELIVSSTGKKIFPSRVESFFKTEPLISQVLLIGDRLPFLTALFTINMPAADTLKGMDAFSTREPAERTQAPPVLTEIQKAVQRVNRKLAPFEQVRKWRVLGRDFSIEEGELTATMKVRRTRAIENFRSDIEQLYAGREMGE